MLIPCALCVAAAAEPGIDRKSPEYRFFRQQFLRANNADLSEQIDPTFSAIQAQVKEIQESSPAVTLGAMLSLVLFESGGRVGFYDTLDKENSFRKRLRDDQPYADQALAHYSYQFGLVPIHTSILRPCMRGTEPTRQQFAELAIAHGYQPSAQDLESVRALWAEACRASITGHIAQPGPELVDFYVLACHSKFGVPANAVRARKASVTTTDLKAFPLYSVEITAPLFFREIRRAGAKIRSDEDAIAVWGGGDAHYASEDRQRAILAAWRGFEEKK